MSWALTLLANFVSLKYFSFFISLRVPTHTEKVVKYRLLNFNAEKTSLSLIKY